MWLFQRLSIIFPAKICPGVRGSPPAQQLLSFVVFLPLDITGRLEQASVTALLFCFFIFDGGQTT